MARERSSRIPVAMTAALLGVVMMAGIWLAPAPTAGAEDWTGWRGPRQDGISSERGILKKWPKGGLKVLWRDASFGAGFSSFSAAGGRLFTARQKNEKQEAVCLDPATGKVIWAHTLGSAYMERQGGDGPRATPTVAGDTVYALGATGGFAALGTQDGKVRWEVNLLKQFGAKNITWGLSGSPFVDGDRVYVQVGAEKAPVVAFNRKTGKVIWRSTPSGVGAQAGYCTPYLITHAGAQQLIVYQGRGVTALNPATGAPLWSYPWKTMFGVNAASPVYHDGVLFISSGYSKGSVALRVPKGAGKKPEVVWKSRVLRNKFSTSVLYKGVLYGFDENRLKCVDFATGREKWRRAGLGHGTLLLADDHLIILSDRGDLVLAEANPEAYREVARMPEVLTETVCWTVPLLYRGVLYLRDLTTVVAVELIPGVD